MKCMTCGAENPPAFVHCIENNQCGGCGGPIYDDSAKELMKELAGAMERMPNDPRGIAGWLLSNYELHKIGDAIPTEKFHRKGQQVVASASDESLKLAPSYKSFLERTDSFKKIQENQSKIGQLKAAKQGKLAQLANMVRQEDFDMPYGDDNPSEEMPIMDADQKEYQALMASGVNPFGDADIYEHTQKGVITNPFAMMAPQDISVLQNKNTVSAEETALMNTREGQAFLNQSQMKKLKAQEALESGGGNTTNGGKFWRAGG